MRWLFGFAAVVTGIIIFHIVFVVYTSLVAAGHEALGGPWAWLTWDVARVPSWSWLLLFVVQLAWHSFMNYYFAPWTADDVMITKSQAAGHSMKYTMIELLPVLVFYVVVWGISISHAVKSGSGAPASTLAPVPAPAPATTPTPPPATPPATPPVAPPAPPPSAAPPATPPVTPPSDPPSGDRSVRLTPDQLDSLRGRLRNASNELGAAAAVLEAARAAGTEKGGGDK